MVSFLAERSGLGLEFGLACATNRSETFLELVNPTSGVDKLLLSCEERVSVGGYTG